MQDRRDKIKKIYKAANPHTNSHKTKHKQRRQKVKGRSVKDHDRYSKPST